MLEKTQISYYGKILHHWEDQRKFKQRGINNLDTNNVRNNNILPSFVNFKYRNHNQFVIPFIFCG